MEELIQEPMHYSKFKFYDICDIISANLLSQDSAKNFSLTLRCDGGVIKKTFYKIFYISI